MPTLDIQVRANAVVFLFGGESFVLKRTGFGATHSVSAVRSGGSWIVTFSGLSVVGLSNNLSFVLHIVHGTTGWRISGALNDFFGEENALPLCDWLAGISTLQLISEYLPRDWDPRVQLESRKGRISLASSGAVTFSSQNRHRIDISPISLDVQTTTWSHPRKRDEGWSLLFEGCKVVDSKISLAKLGQSMTMAASLAGDGTAAAQLSHRRQGSGLIYWDGPVQLNALDGADGSQASLYADVARFIAETGSKASSFRLWARSADIRAKASVRETDFLFVGLEQNQSDGFELECKGGRLPPLRLRMGLRRIRHGIAGADLSDWEFPDSPVHLNLSEAETLLHLAKSHNDDHGLDGSDGGLADETDAQVDVDEDIDSGSVSIKSNNATFTVDVSASLLSLFRARDLFETKFGFSQFALVDEKDLPSGAVLRPFGSARNPSLLVAHFAAQHVEEEVFLSNPTVEDGAVSEARASGPSRIAFRIDETVEAWPLTLEQFTKWNGLALNVSGRAFSEDSTVQEQLDYVGIGQGIGRRRAMELIRASVERDRAMDTARPDSRHSTTALEMRNRMVLSPSATGSQVIPLQTDADEGSLRGNQLWSARVVPATPKVTTPVAEAKSGEQSETRAPLNVEDFTTKLARDLRVVWVRGVDLGFLHGTSVDNKDNVPPWALDPDSDSYTFTRAVSQRQMRELMTMTSIPALMAKRRIIVMNRDTGQRATEAEIQAFYDPNNAAASNLYFEDDPHGQVVAAPDGYTYPFSLPLQSLPQGGSPQERQSQVGIAVPKTLGASKVVLTPWGGSFQSRTVFEPYSPEPVLEPAKYPGADWGPALNLELIQQHIHLGEDIFVVTADKGFLVPLGHRATYVEVTRRSFTPNAAHNPQAEDFDNTAYPIKTSYLAVNRPEKTFPALGQPFKGRAGPGRKRITFLTTVSPPILNPRDGTDDADKIAAGRIPDMLNDQFLIFWPRISPSDGSAGSDLLWEVMIDEDTEPHRVPLMFVNNSVAQSPTEMEAAIRYYREKAPAQARTIDSGGQPHQFAHETADKQTRFKTRSMLLSVTGRARGDAGIFKTLFGTPTTQVRDSAEDFTITPVMEGADQPGFYPAVDTAVIQVQMIDRLLGRTNGATTVSYNRQWLDSGFLPEANPSELFLDVRDRLPVDFSSDGTAAGGFAKPNMDVAHLSREKGPIGGIKRYDGANKEAAFNRSGTTGAESAASKGVFDPSEFLGGAANSNFLGIFTLQSVLKASSMKTGAPQITEETSYDTIEGTGQNAFKRLETALQDAGIVIENAIDGFEATLADAFSGIAGANGNFELGDYYPDLEDAIQRLTTALESARTEALKLAATVPNTADDKNADIRKARDKLGNVTAGLVSAVKDVVAAIDAITQNPVPQVVDAAIDEIRSNWNRLRKVLVGDLEGLIKTALDDFLNDLLFEAFQQALPLLDLYEEVGEARDEAAQFIAVMMGYARRTEIELRAEVARRVNAGLSEIPGNPNASPTEVDAYVDGIVAGDTERLAMLFEEDLRDYVEGRFDAEAKLLENAAASLLAEQFSTPLQELYRRVSKVQKIIANQASAGEEALIDALGALLAAAMDAALRSGSLRAMSSAYEAATDLCKQATAEIAGLTWQADQVLDNAIPLFGQFDLTEQELIRLRDKLSILKLPAKPEGLGKARGQALSAIKRLLVRVDEGKFLAHEMATQVKGRLSDVNATSADACLALSDLEPVGQLFKLQASVLAILGDVSMALKNLIDEADAATQLPERLALVEAATKSGRADELDTIKDGVAEATTTLKAALRHALGLGKATDFSSLKALRDDVKAAAGPFGEYAKDFEAAVTQIEAAATELAIQIDAIDSPADAVVLVRQAREFAARECKAVAGFLSQATRYGDDLLEDVETWLRQVLDNALDLALPLYSRVAQPVLSTMVGALIDRSGVPTPLGYFVRKEITNELRTAQKEMGDELTKIEALRTKLQSGDDFSALRADLEALIRIKSDNAPAAPRTLALPRAVASVRDLTHLLLDGRFSDILTLERLKDDIETAILNLLPVKVGVVFPWATPIGDFPPGKPIFEIATLETKNRSGNQVLNDDRYWTIDDGKGGEENVRKVFYEDHAGSIDQAAFKKRKGDLVLDSGASFHLITGEKEFWADAWLHPFTLNILPGFDVVKLHFRAAKFTAGKDKSTRVSVLPEDFELGKQIQFISALTSYLSGGGKQGPYYDIGILPPQIEVGVRYNLPTIPLGPVIFSQVSINVAAILPLSEGELLLKASVGRRDRPFLISIPPYGGGGHIGMTANSQIIGFEASMEYGAVVPLDLALIKGHGQVTAGIYISKTIDGLTVFSGYLRAIGEGSIGVFGIAVHIELSLTHVNGKMVGRVFVSFTFSVGFIDITFSFEIERQINSSREKNAMRFAAYKAPPALLGARLSPILVHSPPRMTRWNDYNGAYPEGLSLPRTVADAKGEQK